MVEQETPRRGVNTTVALLTGAYFAGPALSWTDFRARNR
jgi:hypothetical protein